MRSQPRSQGEPVDVASKDPATSSMEASPLGVSERVSIVNALMAQDRTEIRDRQEAVFRLTYYVVPGSIGIAAFSVAQPALKWVLFLGQILLLLLYAIAFLTFRKWLADARACLQIRESFYKEPNLLSASGFDPFTMQPHHREVTIRDRHLWFPFGVTVSTVVAMLVYMMTT